MNFDSIKKMQDVDIKNKKVLVRVDYNVPLKDGKVDNNKRIVATEKTVKYLLDNNCRVVLMAHLGRPKGRPNATVKLSGQEARIRALLRKGLSKRRIAKRLRVDRGTLEKFLRERLAPLSEG